MTRMQLVTLSILLYCTSGFAETTATFSLPSDVVVTIKEAAFREAKFDLVGCSEKSYTCRINGHIPFGVAFGLPKTYLKSITVSFQGTAYALDVTHMYNAWGNRPLAHPGGVRYFGGKCFEKKNCQFRGLFSDAAGSFVAEWLIVDGFPMRTVLTGSNDVVNLFTKHIEPPEFN